MSEDSVKAIVTLAFCLGSRTRDPQVRMLQGMVNELLKRNAQLTVELAEERERRKARLFLLGRTWGKYWPLPVNRDASADEPSAGGE
jgi:hypothetical protein